MAQHCGCVLGTASGYCAGILPLGQWHSTSTALWVCAVQECYWSMTQFCGCVLGTAYGYGGEVLLFCPNLGNTLFSKRPSLTPAQYNSYDIIRLAPMHIAMLCQTFSAVLELLL